MDVEEMKIDCMSISGHKLYGGEAGAQLFRELGELTYQNLPYLLVDEPS